MSSPSVPLLQRTPSIINKTLNITFDITSHSLEGREKQTFAVPQKMVAWKEKSGRNFRELKENRPSVYGGRFVGLLFTNNLFRSQRGWMGHSAVFGCAREEGKPLQPSQGESLVGGVPCSKCALAVTLNSCSSRLPGTQSLVHSMGEGGEQVPERASDCVFPSGCSFPARNNYGVMWFLSLII